MTAVTRVLLGERGFERAAVWSVAGFGLTVAAFRVAKLLDALAPWWVAAVCATVVALGVIGFAWVGGGVLPSILLAYGPLTAVLFETVGPTLTLVAGGGVVFEPAFDGGSAALTVGEPLAVAVAAAVAVGGAGFVVGRTLAARSESGVETGGKGHDDSGTPDSPTAGADD
ncbi:MAG: hypothetical protein PPP55_08030 [Halorubrum sp.]